MTGGGIAEGGDQAQAAPTGWTSQDVNTVNHLPGPYRVAQRIGNMNVLRRRAPLAWVPSPGRAGPQGAGPAGTNLEHPRPDLAGAGHPLDVVLSRP
jgi:hypothetical protein